MKKLNGLRMKMSSKVKCGALQATRPRRTVRLHPKHAVSDSESARGAAAGGGCVLRAILGKTAFRSTTVLAAFVLSGAALCAQEALFRSLNGEQATMQLRGQLERLPYSARWKDLRVLVSPSLGLEFTDNVQLLENDAESDFILTPSTSFHATHPIGEANVFNLDLGIGYSKYFNRTELDRILVTPGSSVQLNMMVKDVLINVHNRMSYQLDPLNSGAVSGVGQFGGLDNTAGISASWNAERVSASLGYDFVRWISADDFSDYLTRSSHMLVARGGVRLHPALTAGLEATVSPTSYDTGLLNDNTAYSAGAYGQWMLTERFSVVPRVGYTVYTFSVNDFGYVPDQFNAVYFGLELVHRPNSILNYRLSLNNQVRPGVNANLNEELSVTLSATWSFIRNLPLTTSVFYEDGSQSASIFTEEYTRVGGGVGAAYRLTERSTLSLNYQYTVRDSEIIGRDFTQNRVTLMFNYRF